MTVLSGEDRLRAGRRGRIGPPLCSSITSLFRLNSVSSCSRPHAHTPEHMFLDSRERSASCVQETRAHHRLVFGLAFWGDTWEVQVAPRGMQWFIVLLGHGAL